MLSLQAIRHILGLLKAPSLLNSEKDIDYQNQASARIKCKNSPFSDKSFHLP